MSTKHETAISDFASLDLDSERFRPARTRALVRGFLVIGMIAVIAIVATTVLIRIKHSDLEVQAERRLEVLSLSRAEVIETWFDGIMRPAEQVVDSELFRLFAIEMDLAGGDVSGPGIGTGMASEAAAAADGLGVPLPDQLPYLARVLSDFCQNSGYVAGYVVDRDGIAYVTSAAAETISEEQQAIAKTVFDSGQLAFGPARNALGGLVIDFYSPIYAVQGSASGGETVGVLLLSAPITDMVTDVLTPPPLAEAGERVVLLQQLGDRLFKIMPAASPPLLAVDDLDLLTAGRPLPFAERPAVGGPGMVYSVGSPVEGPAWWVVQQVDVEAVKAQMSGFVAALLIVAVLTVVLVVSIFGAFWWRLSNEQNSALARQLSRLGARISSQKRFLDSVNNSIADYIGVKSKDGRYSYLNPAFARAVGREVDDAIGLDDTAIFGQGTAQRLSLSDRQALDRSAPVTFNAEVYLGGRLHHLLFSKVPYLDDSGEKSGIVSVMRDVTALVEEQRKGERAMQQMVAALVCAVEMRDAYLAGHSRRMAGFARAVAERLDASAEEIATVEIAANLSQIGKLEVPRKILTKPERLNPAEIAQLQTHIDHTMKILRGIDFDLPVVETIAQMHERLDGKGYPAGLSGQQIRLTARILGACDVFCARVEPRTYRSGIDPDAALEILEKNPDRYDAKVVAALRSVVNSVPGEKLIADLARI